MLLRQLKATLVVGQEEIIMQVD